MTRAIEEHDKFRNQKLVIQGLRLGVYILILSLALMMHLGQIGFFNWNLYSQFYSVTILGLLAHLFGIIFQKSFFSHPKIVQASFVFDVILISFLLSKSELSVSLFLFLYLIEIFLIALVFGTRGAVLLAAWCSICFSFVSLLGPELKALTFFFSLVLYNVAFFAVAWIAGLLSEQLESQGVSLNYLRALNESIVDTIPSGLLTVQRSGVVLTANPGAQHIFKLSDMEGLYFQDLLPDLAKILGENEAQNLGKRIEVPLRRENDNLILSVQVLPHDSDNDSLLVVLEDVTEIRRLELTVLHQQKLAAIGGLASGIAHELGNPLAAVSANIQFLEPKIKIEDDMDRKLIQNTHREISRLGRLIGEFKDFAKPEKVPVDSIRLDILLSDVLDNISKDQSLKKEVNVRKDFHEVPIIQGSRDKLIQVFTNIIANAYHAVSDVPSPEVFISCRAVGLDVVVKIRDNGVGMSEETKARLFEPFYTTKGRHGTGLGMAIAYKILESHQARVSVDTTKGQGSEFTLRFPIKIQAGNS